MVFIPAVMPPLYTDIHVESMKGGMLMKSKHCTYGKKAACSDFCNYHFNDTISHKNTIAAPLAQERLL